MKIGVAIFTALVALSPVMYGQAAPTAVASNSSWFSPLLGGITPDGTFHYSLSAAEIIEHGLYTNSGTDASTSLSGNAAYQSTSENRPFSLLYSGGVLFTTQYQSTVQTYQNASVSQELVMRNWVFGVSDSVSYLPQSPTVGASGVAGTGDIGLFPGPGQGPAGGILTNYGTRVGNSLDGDVERRLGGATSINGTADWTVLRFLDDNTGLDTTSIGGTVGLNHRLSARTSVRVNAAYSVFTYGSYGNESGELGLNNLSFQTRGINFGFQRLLTHSLSVSASAGPQWISSSNSSLVPSTLTTAASASLLYNRKLTSATLSYIRGASGGSGVQQGSLTNSVVASAGRPFGPNWQGSINAGYTHSSSLITYAPVNEVLGIEQSYNTTFGGAQIYRRLGAHLSAFASLTIQNQSGSASSAAPNIFSGTSQIFSVGITYTPRSTRLGQF